MGRSSPPLGSKVICIVFGLFALLNGVQLVEIILTGPLTVGVGVASFSIALLSVGYAVVGIGLWRTRSWAWKATYVLLAVAILSTLAQQPVDFLLVLLFVLIGVYLYAQRDLYIGSS
ncbi:hypothetical protein OB955_24780 [Halobacteria archaeon AArc-m2/3/4]|uniref:Uncharacterized protein n=1 Tax=Natronoglomus mannanivorans TaxID=2979990 RepID=A0AAP3E2H6_9EURY|nr:hypothetical protein [Halobacteria archaeon AArc-xg1-1]MCU4975899.1 hypothetical protein [Halobacteria archaeon AArc-m2/3/4]